MSILIPSIVTHPVNVDFIVDYLKEHAPTVPRTRMDLTRAAIGNTGYLDCLVAKDLPKGFVYGLDPHNRPYVAVRVVHSFVNADDDQDYLNDEERERVVVAFKRYTDLSNITWVCSDPYAVGSFERTMDTLLPYLLEGEIRKTWSEDSGERFQIAL